MRVWCYELDIGGWGRQFYVHAVELGLDCSLFYEPSSLMRPGDYAFMRIPQWGSRCELSKQYASQMKAKGIKLIPELSTIFAYEDKAYQVQAYRDWMPETEIFRKRYDSWRDCERFIERIGFPFVSKAKEGSSSVNVRLVKNVQEARNEWELAMEGAGIPIRLGSKEGRQLDYLIWQKFCDGNTYDIRICRNGKYDLMLGRGNAHGSFFASGSHNNWPINEPDDFERGALDKAQQFFEEHDMKWCGIDLVYDFQECDWKILETTLAWSLPAYDNCRYFGTGYHGRNIWQLLSEQILSGVFE